MHNLRYGLAAGLIAFAAAAASAQQVRLAPADATADRLVAEALQNTPEMTAARAAVDAAQHRVEPARTLPDPSASLTYQNDGRTPSLGSAEGSYAGLMLTQALPWPGKLALAGKAAASEAKEVETGTVGRTTLTIESRVRTAWYDLELAHALDRLVDERRETARQIEATTRARYAAGLAIQQDVLRAQVELARIDELKSAQAATIASRTAELNRLLGRQQDAPVGSPADIPSAASIPDAASIVASVLARSPEAAAARQAVETGSVRVDIAKKNFLPDLVVSGGSMYRGNFEMGPMWQVGVGVSLPIWSDRKQKNQLAEAEARVIEQRAQGDVIARELELRTRERIAQLESADRIAALYRDKVVPLDQLSYESALASYQAGKVPFITVFEAINTLYADRATYLGRLAEAAKWRVAIDEASLQPTAMGATPSMPSTATASASAPASSPAAGSGSAMTSMR